MFARLYFFSFLILFKNSSRNFSEDVLHLVFVFVAFVATSSSVAGSCVRSKFFIENDLLSKLLKTFSLALIIILSHLQKLLKKSFPKFFNSLAKLLCLLSAFSIDKCPSGISLKKQ